MLNTYVEDQRIASGRRNRRSHDDKRLRAVRGVRLNCGRVWLVFRKKGWQLGLPRVIQRMLPVGWLAQELWLAQRRWRKNKCVLLSPRFLIEPNPAVVISWKNKVYSLSHFVAGKTGLGRRFGGQECCHCILDTGTYDVQIAIVGWREMELEKLP